MSDRATRLPRLLVVGLFGLGLLACERPPMDVTQTNYPGVAIQQVTNPRLQAAKLAANQMPAPLPPVPTDGPAAGETFKNLQVLGDTSALEFTRLMAAMTTWVAPANGCNYCHAPGDLVVDRPYTKVVARRMIQMTRYINREWKDHVGDTGVTCYTCHRGQPVPEHIWYEADPGDAVAMVGSLAGQNSPAPQVGLTSLPYDPFTAFLRDGQDIRIQTASALPVGSTRNIKDAEWTYGFMIHISEALGVNCTHCHNSRAFSPWEQSSPARVTAWHGIRMVRDLNLEYLAGLSDVFPDNRKGPAGDVYKINCGTCHQGLSKPLLGVSMLKDYPRLAQ